MQMFIAALFIIASNSKQPRHSSGGEWQTAVSKCNRIIFINGKKKKGCQASRSHGGNLGAYCSVKEVCLNAYNLKDKITDVV